MSDGPHRSLNMPRSWKILAERAGNAAYAPEEVCETFLAALAQDWCAEIPGGLVGSVRHILENPQACLFPDQPAEELEALRDEAAGFPLAKALLDNAIQAVAQRCAGEAALLEAIANTLRDRSERGARQIEEHYLREPPRPRTAPVCQRLAEAMRQSDMTEVAGRLIKARRSKAPRQPVKRTGLDEGASL